MCVWGGGAHNWQGRQSTHRTHYWQCVEANSKTFCWLFIWRLRNRKSDKQVLAHSQPTPARVPGVQILDDIVYIHISNYSLSPDAPCCVLVHTVLYCSASMFSLLCVNGGNMGYSVYTTTGGSSTQSTPRQVVAVLSLPHDRW